MSKENVKKEDFTEKKCKCNEECSCEENCSCGEECTCKEKESKDKESKKCHCSEHEKCDCGCDCSEENVSGQEYFNLAKQIQADFENFSRHALEDIKQAKISGQASIIEAFLPCLDTFKEAKKSINDADVLKGVEMIENKIIETLKNVGVEKIESVGQKYDPHIHNVIAVLNIADKDNDVIIDEYQAGYIFNGKVIRYSKVIVNKKED